jgi:Na+/phosphate symporter
MKPIEKSLRVYQEKISNVMEELLNMLSYIYDGFIKHKKSYLQEAEKLGKKIHQFEKDFTEEIIKEGDKDAIRLLISIAGHIERTGDCYENVIKTVHTKISEGTLFSDKAVQELNFLFNSSKDLIRNVKDIVLTLNPVLIEHSINLGNKINSMADEFATQHEERLVTGICHPKHSSMYLDMLDNLRMGVWHLKEIVKKLQNY